MHAPILPRHNRVLSEHELSVAGAICREVAQSVADRDRYIAAHGIDRAFALPDANWSYEAPNEFVQLFLRVAECDAKTISHLRIFSQVFTGFSLYKACDAYGLETWRLQVSATLEAEIEAALAARNPQYVDYWKSLTTGLPGRYLLKPPSMLGECGHEVDGVIVNHDTCAYQERINLIHDSGLGAWLDSKLMRSGDVRICEIGAGYGALAYWFRSAFPNCSYTIVDLPESLLFSRLYLSLTRPDVATSFGLALASRATRFVPNYMAGQLDEPFDLVINTLSMSEMSAYQVRQYAHLMTTRWLVDGGLFFEQNKNGSPVGLLCPADVLASAFPERLNLNPSNAVLQQGIPNVWSLQPASLESILTLAGSERTSARKLESIRKNASLKLAGGRVGKAAKVLGYKLLGQQRAERIRSKLAPIIRRQLRA